MRKNLLIPLAATLIIALLAFAASLPGRLQSNRGAIDGDGIGYFAYLNQVLLQKNFGSDSSCSRTLDYYNGRSLIRYPCGTALLQSPFVVTAWLVSDNNMTGQATSSIQTGVIAAALFYLWMGLFFTFLLIRSFGIPRNPALLSLLILAAGTNLLVYSTVLPSMSHVYSFATLAALLLVVRKFATGSATSYLWVAAVLLGIVYLLRPVNLLIIVFLPVLFPRPLSAAAYFVKHPRHLVFFIVLFLCVAFVQNLLWYIQAGSWFIRPYRNEGFYWTDPELFRVLFGFRKGFFLYTPVAGIALISGIAALFSTQKTKAVLTLVFFLLLFWLISAWWCWSYSDGFGMRPLVDYYAIFGWLLATGMHHWRKAGRWIILAASGMAVLLNLTQTFQYQTGILHPDYMSRFGYSYIFGRTHQNYRNRIGGANDIVPYDKHNPVLLGDYSRPWVEHLSPGREFACEMNIPANEALRSASNIYASIEVAVCDPWPGASKAAQLGSAILYPLHPGFNRQQSFLIHPLPGRNVNRWSKYHYTLIIPKPVFHDFTLRFFVWNPEKSSFFIKNLRIQVYKTL